MSTSYVKSRIIKKMIKRNSSDVVEMGVLRQHLLRNTPHSSGGRPHSRCVIFVGISPRSNVCSSSSPSSRRRATYLLIVCVRFHGTPLFPPRLRTNSAVQCRHSATWETSFKAKQTIRDLDTVTKIMCSIENPRAAGPCAINGCYSRVSTDYCVPTLVPPSYRRLLQPKWLNLQRTTALNRYHIRNAFLDGSRSSASDQS